MMYETPEFRERRLGSSGRLRNRAARRPSRRASGPAGTTPLFEPSPDDSGYGVRLERERRGHRHRARRDVPEAHLRKVRAGGLLTKLPFSAPTAKPRIRFFRVTRAMTELQWGDPTRRSRPRARLQAPPTRCTPSSTDTPPGPSRSTASASDRRPTASPLSATVERSTSSRNRGTTRTCGLRRSTSSPDAPEKRAPSRGRTPPREAPVTPSSPYPPSRDGSDPIRRGSRPRRPPPFARGFWRARARPSPRTPPDSRRVSPPRVGSETRRPPRRRTRPNGGARAGSDSARSAGPSRGRPTRGESRGPPTPGRSLRARRPRCSLPRPRVRSLGRIASRLSAGSGCRDLPATPAPPRRCSSSPWRRARPSRRRRDTWRYRSTIPG